MCSCCLSHSHKHPSLRPVGLFTVKVAGQHADTPLVLLQQLQDGQHDVVDVAEAAGLCLLGMVHATCRMNFESSLLM